MPCRVVLSYPRFRYIGWVFWIRRSPVAVDTGGAMEGTLQYQGLKEDACERDVAFRIIESDISSLQKAVDEMVAGRTSLITDEYLRTYARIAFFGHMRRYEFAQAGLGTFLDEFQLAYSGTLMIPGMVDITPVSDFPDYVPEFTFPVGEEGVLLTVNGTEFTVPMEPGNQLNLLVSEDAVSFGVQDFVTGIFTVYCGGFHDGSVYEGDCSR